MKWKYLKNDLNLESKEKQKQNNEKHQISDPMFS